jgi:hypothetical protein
MLFRCYLDWHWRSWKQTSVEGYIVAECYVVSSAKCTYFTCGGILLICDIVCERVPWEDRIEVTTDKDGSRLHDEDLKLTEADEGS